MKFHEYTTWWQTATKIQRGNSTVEEFYKQLTEKAKVKKDVSAILTFGWESCWYECSRPYFKVWPAITPALEKVKLDVTLPQLPTKLDFPVLLRFPVGQEPTIGDCRLTTVCMWHLYPQARDVDSTCLAMALSLRRDKPGGGELFADSDFMLRDDGSEPHKTIHEYISAGMLQLTGNDRPDGYTDEELRGSVELATRISVGTILLADDPEFVRPEVLADDRRKFEETGDQKYVAKAVRRGVRGWSLGETLEKVPHWRRPHFAIRWTGRGRMSPVLTAIKGSIVHRDKLREVPTGYLTPEDEEFEP